MGDYSGYSRYAIRANERPYYRIAYWCKGVWCNDPRYLGSLHGDADRRLHLCRADLHP